MRINRAFFKYFAYSLLILILYILQGTPNLVPQLFGSKPLLLIPIALSIASQENKIPSLIFGAVCGLLTDIGDGGPIGFFAITLTLISYFEAHIFESLFVPSVVSALIVSAISIPLLICLYFLIFKVFAGIDEWGYLFANHYISRIVYSLVVVLPCYYLIRFLSKNLSD